MNIEVHQPRLEALIHERMASGLFQTIEDALLQALESAPLPATKDQQSKRTEDIMLRWRVLVEQGRKPGHTYSQPDLIIAATALEHNLPS